MTPSLIFPVSFIQYLSSNSPSFSCLPPDLQASTAQTLYAGFVNLHPHHMGNSNLFTDGVEELWDSEDFIDSDLGVVSDCFPIFWKVKKKAFGSAATFDTINKLLGWFRLEIGAKVGEHARGYSLTDEARILAKTYFESTDSDPTPSTLGLVDEKGRRYRKPQNSVLSKTKNGGNSTRFRDICLKPEVVINVDAVRQFYAVSKAWMLNEECPQYGEVLYSEWDRIKSHSDVATARNRVQRAGSQALAMLNLAKHFSSAGNLIPGVYTESPQGRLFCEGSLNLQRCVRELRRAALTGCYDVDIENCHWTILAQLAGQAGVDIPYIDNYLKNKNQVRDEIASDLEIPAADAKFVLLALIYGAKLTFSRDAYCGAIQKRIGGFAMINARSLPTLININGDIKRVRTAVLESAQFTTHKPGYIVNAAQRQVRIKGSTPAKLLAHVLQGAESSILRVCMKSCSSIVLVQHDGFCSRQKIDVTALSAVVQEKTGIAVTFSQDLL